MKTLDKIMDVKLDKLSTSEWAIAHGHWMELRLILTEGVIE